MSGKRISSNHAIVPSQSFLLLRYAPGIASRMPRPREFWNINSTGDAVDWSAAAISAADSSTLTAVTDRQTADRRTKGRKAVDMIDTPRRATTPVSLADNR